MSNEPIEQDVEALAKVIRPCRMTPYDDREGGTLWRHASAAEQARAILASDWYATRIAEARREDAAEALDDRSEEAIRGREAAAYLKGRREALDDEAARIAEAPGEGAAEVVARVEALADEWDDPDYPIHAELAKTLRAALRGDA